MSRTQQQEWLDYNGVSVAQVAAALGCSETHVTELARAGELEMHDIGREGAKRPTYRITRESVERFLARRRVRPRRGGEGAGEADAA